MLYANFNNTTIPGSDGSFFNPFGQVEFLNRIENTGLDTDDYSLYGTLPITRSINFRYYSNISAWFQNKPWRITGTSNFNLDLKGNPNYRCIIQGGIIIFPGVIRQSYGNTMYNLHIDCLQVLCNFFTKPVFGYNDRAITQTFLSVRCTDKYSDASLLANAHEGIFNDCAIKSTNWPAGNFSNVAVHLWGNKTNKSLAQWTSVSGSIAVNVDNTFSYAFPEVWPDKDAADSAFSSLFGTDGFRLNLVFGVLGFIPTGISSEESFGSPDLGFYKNPLEKFITKSKFGYWEYLQMLKSLFPRGRIWDFTLPFDKTYEAIESSSDNITFFAKAPGTEFRDFESSVVVGNDCYLIANTGIRLYKWNTLLTETILVSNSVDSELTGKLFYVQSTIYCVGLDTGNVYRYNGTNAWVKQINGNGALLDVIVYLGNFYAIKEDGKFYVGIPSNTSWTFANPDEFTNGNPTALLTYTINSFTTFYATTDVGTVERNNGSWSNALDTGNNDLNIKAWLVLSSNNHLFVCSDKGMMYEFNDITQVWKLAANPHTTDSEAYSLIEFNNNIYAINTRYSGSQILRWNGVDKWYEIYSSSKEFNGFFIIGSRLFSYTDDSIYAISSSAQGINTQTIVGSVLGNLMSCFATELERIDVEINNLRMEAVPGLSVNLLPDWEKVAGLPDSCSPLAGDIIQRQQIVHSKITQSKGNFEDEILTGSATYFINYALSLGITITIDEDTVGTPFRVTNKTTGVKQRVTRMPIPDGIDGSRLSSAGSLHYWKVNIINDPFTNVNTMKCIFLKIKPAHTFLSFS